jgi:hypothetical protein
VSPDAFGGARFVTVVMAITSSSSRTGREAPHPVHPYVMISPYALYPGGA